MVELKSAVSEYGIPRALVDSGWRELGIGCADVGDADGPGACVRSHLSDDSLPLHTSKRVEAGRDAVTYGRIDDEIGREGISRIGHAPLGDGDAEVITNRLKPRSQGIGFRPTDVGFGVVLSHEKSTGDDAGVADGDVGGSSACNELGHP